MWNLHLVKLWDLGKWVIRSEAKKIWGKRRSGLWCGSGQAAENWHQEPGRNDRACCYMAPAVQGRAGSDSVRRLCGKDSTISSRSIFRTSLFCSLSLLTVTLFWSVSTHDSLLLSLFYWGLLPSEPRKSYSAALVSTSRTISGPFYPISHQLASLFLLSDHLQITWINPEVVKWTSSPKLTCLNQIKDFLSFAQTKIYF